MSAKIDDRVAHFFNVFQHTNSSIIHPVNIGLELQIIYIFQKLADIFFLSCYEKDSIYYLISF